MSSDNPLAESGESRSGVPTNVFLSRLVVEGLFGQYNYDLKPASDYNESSKILIFYGENGTGKTTLLWLIHHLLSKTGANHRTFVGRTKFKLLSVWLGSQTVVSATRKEATEGNFVMSIEDLQGKTELLITVDEDGIVRMKGQENELAKLIDRLPALDLPFLKDTRRMTPREDEEQDQAMLFDRHLRYEREVRVGGRILVSPRDEGRDMAAPERALRRLSRWVSHQALQGSTEGQLNVNTVYGEIVKRIGSPSPKKQESASPNPDELIALLRTQATRTKQFSEYGLTSDLNVDSFIESIERNKGSKQRLLVIEQILRPFVEGNTARLDALQQIQTAVNNFVACINSFYRNKQLIFHSRTGARVVTSDNRRISVKKLSSGEQELLLLFCDLLITKKTPTIFIIDEPELSLNITWQRILVDALLKLAGNSPIQFLLATHSIELLAQRRKSVLRLRIEGTSDAEQD
jgi:ABC-type molybdenum transport system ATPase subunit/photorepair protein PhrA